MESSRCQPSLKLFGFNMMAKDETSTSATGPTSPVSSTTATSEDRKFECQYCGREFANSQALGGHQNAHKKERQQLKRAQMHRAQPAAFYPPPHLLSMGTPASSSLPQADGWMYFSRPGMQLHAPHGCGTTDDPGRMYGQDRVLNGRVWGVNRFAAVEPGLDSGEVCGLDLHLSLAPAGS